MILAKTIKGWTLGPEIEARNATHQIKKMTKAQLLALRDRLYLNEEIPDEALDGDDRPRTTGPPEGSAAHEYLIGPAQGPGRPPAVAGSSRHRPRRCDRRPRRSPTSPPGRGPRPSSTTMAFARLLRNLVRDPDIGPLVAPIVPDEARTFGLEADHRRGPRSTRPTASATRRSTPTCRSATPRAERARSSKRASPRPGALAAFTALATAYATWGQPMLPVFLFYSMFGFQRVGDLIWALGDIRGRGILAGCTAGRTTLQGEGLQHDDGQSPLLASIEPGRGRSTTRRSPTRSRSSSRTRIERDPRSRARGPLLVPDPLQRELPDAGPARRRRGRGRARGDPGRRSTASRRRPSPDEAGPAHRR